MAHETNHNPLPQYGVHGVMVAKSLTRLGGRHLVVVPPTPWWRRFLRLIFQPWGYRKRAMHEVMVATRTPEAFTDLPVSYDPHEGQHTFGWEE